MRVKVFPVDSGGCGHYRIRWPAQALADQGADVTLAHGLAGIYADDWHGTPHQLGVQHPDCDVVVLQRALSGEVVDTIPHLQAMGVAVVVEIDDHFHALTRSNPAYLATHPDYSPALNRDHLARACHLADLVTVSTPALAKAYGRHGRVAVLPNLCRARWLDLDHQPGEQVGWTGVLATHQNDLDVVGDAVADIIVETGWGWLGIGSADPAKVLGVPAHRATTLPWADLTTDDYPNSIGQLGVGIVPLADTAFNRAKSWLKGIEYAACGVPFVASDVADYRRLRRTAHVGRLARRPSEWAAELRKLTTDPNYRADTGHAYRAAMAAHTIEGHAGRWWDAWTRAYNRKGT